MFSLQPLSQMDPRWKNVVLGTDNSTTIGKYGCLLTCMTMVSNGFGANETPATLNDKMKTAGGFQGALVMPAVLPKAVPGVQYKKFVLCENYPAPVDEVDATLALNLPVIIEVDYSPSAGLQNHWVVIYDKKGNDYLIQDPWPYPVETGPVTLASRYGFAGNPAQIIKAVVWITSSQGIPQPPMPQPKPIPTSGFAVYAAVDGLALRSQPLVADNNLITRLPIQAKLFVTEEAGAAKAKIGQQNQWMKVQETQKGYEGYVAAWYVSSTPAAAQPTQPPATPPQPPATGPTPAQPPATQPTTPQAASSILYAMTEGLALRKQPVIADQNLFKREPLNAQFLALDPAAVVSQRLGITNQWLKVRDIEGDEGYVAAWYVSSFRQDALGVEPSPTVPPPASPATPAKLIVRAAEDNLALRSQPTISDATLVKRYPLLSEFLVIEPAGPAQAKIGVLNQWLNVRSIDGQTGYVAAWYVTRRAPAQVVLPASRDLAPRRIPPKRMVFE